VVIEGLLKSTRHSAPTLQQQIGYSCALIGGRGASRDEIRSERVNPHGVQSTYRLMHILAHLTRFFFHSNDGGAQLLSRYIPVNNLLRLGTRWRIHDSEIVHKEDTEDDEEHSRYHTC
jgi:hypothetical protein